jgi:hypothetical protein
MLPLHCFALLALPTLMRSKQRSFHTRSWTTRSSVGRTLDLALDVVAFAEESEPVVQHFLVLVRQVRPIGSALLGFERGLCKGAGGVFAGEDC